MKLLITGGNLENQAAESPVDPFIAGMRVMVVSKGSADKTSQTRGLIVVLTVLLGGMLGVFGAFLAKFAVAVKSSLVTSTESFSDSE
jgi:hypothetical protein